MPADPRLRPWQLVNKEVVLNTPWFQIDKQRMKTSTGGDADYYVHSGHDSVICVCLTSGGKVILEKQYRPPVEKVSYDYPAGGIERSDKNPEAGIRRELLEEVGFEAHSLQRLGVLDTNPGFSRARLHVFVAYGDIKKTAQPEVTESIVDILVTPPAEIMRLIDEGKLVCTFCIAATFLAFRRLNLITL